MASVSPINVVLPSRMAAYVLGILPPTLAILLPQTDIALLQVKSYSSPWLTLLSSRSDPIAAPD